MVANQSLTYLTVEEIRRLTGRRYAPAQRKVLSSRGIRFTIDGDGKPIVLRAHIERRLLGESSKHDTTPSPDFSVFPAV